MESLNELQRQRIALAEASSAVGKCCLVLGEATTNDMLAKLDSAAREVQDKIEITEAGEWIKTRRNA